MRQAMLREFTPDCCIATCRVLGRVFESFEYYAEAVPVSVYIFNAQMASLLTTGAPIPDEPFARRKLFDSTGAWSVGITRKSADVNPDVIGGRYGGHLVLRVMNTLVDASLQQADRPQYGIVLPALIAFSPQKPVFFTHRRTGGKRCGISVNGCEIVYERIKDYSFSNSPDWLRTGPPNSDVIRKIINEVENRMNHYREEERAGAELLVQRDCLA